MKPTRCTNFSNLFLKWNSTCFGQFLWSIIRSFSLYTQQWYMSLRFTYSLWAGSGWSSILILTENCPKHVEFHFKNKFEKLVRLVSFIIRNLSRCTVTWTSDSVALCFVTTHWFWLLALLVSGVPKIRIWYSLFWQYDAENRSLSLFHEAGPACKMLTSIKSL